MTSRESSEQDEKSVNQSRKSKLSCLYNCFSQSSFSDSELDSDSEYVVINHSVFKIPKNLQAVNNDNTLNPVGGSKEHRTIIVQRGSDRRISVQPTTSVRRNISNTRPTRRNSERRVSASERKSEHSQKADLDEKIYQYIRMKTYERMNPYEMSPNDFLNNISSVFVDNIKDPVPKDPLRRPKIYNRYSRRRKKTDTQIMYERKKERERDASSGKRPTDPRSSRGPESTQQGLRKPTVNPAVMSDLNKSFGEDALGYKAAIEQEDRGREYEEKVLIWKIVVANDEDETKE